MANFVSFCFANAILLWKRLKYVFRLRRVNHKRSDSRPKRTPSQEPCAAQAARMRMSEYAKQVPKPKPPLSIRRPRETSSARSGSSTNRMADFHSTSSRVSSARLAGAEMVGSKEYIIHLH